MGCLQVILPLHIPLVILVFSPTTASELSTNNIRVSTRKKKIISFPGQYPALWKGDEVPHHSFIYLFKIILNITIINIRGEARIHNGRLTKPCRETLVTYL